MDARLMELYFSEIDSRRLDIDGEPEFAGYYHALSRLFDQLWEVLDHRTCNQLWQNIFLMSDRGNMIAFAHGLRLGLCTALWAAGDSPRGEP